MGVVGSDDVVAVTKWCWVLNGLLLALECNPSCEPSSLTLPLAAFLGKIPLTPANTAIDEATANFVREKRDEQIRYVSITKLG
jgi:hypothetical protein